VAHFVTLHSAWLQQGRHHAGIVVSNQRPLGDLLRRLRYLAAALDADAMQDRLEFLSTGNYAGGDSTLAGLTIGAGDSLIFRHLEDNVGGTSGIIVRSTSLATSGVPESSTFVLGTLGLLALGLCGFRSRRRRR
jgi:MYXO-CTERM domain-containing protein